MNKVKLSFLLFALCFSTIALGQKTISATKLTIDSGAALDQKFTEVNLYNINTTELAETLANPDFDSEIRIEFGNDFIWDLLLYENQLRSDNYVLRVLTDQGIIEMQDEETKSYYGYLADEGDSEVRLTVRSGFVYGFVRARNDIYYIEPAKRFQSDLAPNDFIIYQPKDVTEETGTCAVLETNQQLQQGGTDTDDPYRLVGDCYEVDLAIATDYSYYLDRGSDILAVMSYTQGVMNNVAANYQLSGTTNFDNGVEFLIVTNFIVATPGGDPWTPSTDPFTLLPDFAIWGNANGFPVTFDLGQLWTSRDFDGDTKGLAYTGTSVVCSESRYHVLEDFTTSAPSLRVLVAHEIGHNFGATHDGSNTDFIMAPSVTITNNWSTNSKSLINTGITNGSNNCMAACTSGPPVSDFTASTTVGCSGTTITFMNASNGGSNSWSWTFPGGTPSTSTDQNPTVVYNSLGSYSVTMTASNNSGTGTTETKTNFINILAGSATACTPGGTIGGGGVTNFSFADIIDNTGNAAADGTVYVDKSCELVTVLEEGTTYSAQATVGDGSVSLFEGIRVYIDYNNDGVFDNTTESVFNSGGSNYIGIVNFNITTAASPPTMNQILRMRIIANTGFINSACQALTTGQAQDYGVIFINGSLPVSLIDFTAKAKDRHSVLHWHTATELNNDFFTIEHSIDGRQFEVLAKEQGQGSAEYVSFYEYIHENPAPGANYYRLSQTDFDGTHKILGLRVVEFEEGNTIVSIQPNPVRDGLLKLQYVSEVNEEVLLEVVGVDGKLMLKESIQVREGINSVDLPLGELIDGVYFLRLYNGWGMEVVRFVKVE